MKKVSLMLASIMVAGALVGVCACGGKDSDTTPEVEGDFSKEATAQEIADKTNTIDLMGSIFGTDPEAMKFGGKLTEDLSLSGNVKLNIEGQTWDIKVNELTESLSYLVNVTSSEADGLSLTGSGNAKLSVDAEAPAFGVEYIKSFLIKPAEGETPQAPTGEDAAKATPVKANAEANVYNVYNNTENKLYADIANAKLTLGEDTVDFLAADGFLQGNKKLAVDLKTLMSGFGGEGLPFAAEQDANAQGEATAYTLGTLLLMVQSMNGKVYLDTAEGVKVKVSFDVVDLVKSVYSFITSHSFEVTEEASATIDSVLSGVTFTSKTADIYLQFNKDNVFEKAGIVLDIAVSEMNLDFGSEESPFTISGNAALKLNVTVAKTDEKVTAFKDLDTYTDVMTLFGGDKNEDVKDPVTQE